MVDDRYNRCFHCLFRATMLLVPLLGLNYLIIPFRPPPNHPWEYVYEVVSAITASMQVRYVGNFFESSNKPVDMIKSAN